jgi:hypothetical protein
VKRFPFLLAAFILLGASDALAVFELDVQPRKGGQHLRFEESSPGSLIRNEEVTLAVTSDVGTQYRISQTVHQPLTNERGDAIPQQALIVFSPSNPLGTLRTQLETPVTMGQTNVYTSNAAGDSDSFVLVYHVRVPEAQPGGVYRTQIHFTAEPVTPVAGVNQRVVTMDVRVEVRSIFRMSARPARGGRELDLGRVTKETATASQALVLEVEGNAGAPYRVLQRLEEPLTSEAGHVLDEESVTWRSASSGQSAPLGFSPQLVISSDEAGQGDRVEIAYTLSPEASEKAGVYRGVLAFRADSSSPLVPREPVRVPVKAQIDAIFDLEVETLAGSLSFGKISNWEQAQSRSVVLTVKTNMSEPYDVSQVVSRKLTNEQGVSLREENFEYNVVRESAALDAEEGYRPVKEGETVLFSSDAKGSPARITVDYRLRIDPGTKAGQYTSEIKYSLTSR